jgi:hypothetical protein
MNDVVKGLARGQKGQALLLAIILLLVSGLIAAPLLAHMGTGILTGEVYQTRTAELYAADAGVEDAVLKIQNQVDEVAYLYCPASNHSWSYPEPGDPPMIVNGKNVDVTITWVNNTTTGPTYHVESIATGDGSGTKIDAYITGTAAYCSILDHLVTVQQDLDDKAVAALEADLAKLDIRCPDGCANCTVCGRAYDYYSDAYQSIPQKCKGCIAVYNFPSAGWPRVSDLSARYWDDVKNQSPYANSTIDLNGNNMWLGPLKRLASLEILNKDNRRAATLSLNGTLYITGNTTIGMNGAGGKPNLTLQLNGNTIFVASNSTGSGHEALSIGDWCTINGPGAIIAVGDIYFKPNGVAGPNDEPVFVLSVSGTTTIQPGVDFLGAIAGNVDVNIQSGSANVSYPTGGFGPLNFPSLFEVKLHYSIASWEVSPL